MALPQIMAVVPQGSRRLRVHWDSGVGMEALDVRNYRLTANVVPAVVPAIASVVQVGNSVVDLVLAIDTSPGASYSLAADNVMEAIVGWRETYLARAVAKAGILAEEIGCYFDEFDGDEADRWIPNEGGAFTIVDALGGGLIKLHAAAGNTCCLGLYSYPAARLLVDAAKPFYAAARFWLPSNPIPIDGETSMLFKLVITDDTQGLPTGVIAGYFPLFGSTSKFSCGTMNGVGYEVKLSTVSVDNAGFHVLEMWFDGESYAFAYDGEDPIIFDGTYPPSGMIGIIMGTHAGAALDLDMIVDKLLLAFPLPVVAPA